MTKPPIESPRPIESSLPIESLRGELLAVLEAGPVVISSPTGSGKSTQVPRWCPGPVLVVEPRRVACRSLAQWVAQLEGSALGDEVGYQVRDERRCGSSTRILFATPGVVLRIFDRVADFATVILDEFHERGLETDLLLGLLRSRAAAARLIVMSATLDGERLAGGLGGRHLAAEGRTFPVEIAYRPDGVLRPCADRLEGRVAGAVEAALEHDGDVLVFLPGKAEIAACARALTSGAMARRNLEILELHGGLDLHQQSRVFEPCDRTKIILATNVAETSLTVPGVGAVVDSGLVRQTRYFRNRGFLTLVPVALDSADQRAGRAGRTREGFAYRLWSSAAELDARTLPEIYRESLVPMVLAAAACEERLEELPLPDPPKEHALESAREELLALGALSAAGRLTDRGRALFGLPLEAFQGRLLVEARQRDGGERGILADVVDLVSVLAVGRPLLPGPRREAGQDAPVPEPGTPAFLEAHCDAVALIRGLRQPRGPEDRRHPFVLGEARRVRLRLRRAFDLPEMEPASAAGAPIDRHRLARAVLAADPRTAHVARRRGRRIAWSNGGTEVELGRDSAAGPGAEELDALLVLDTRALAASGGRDTRVLITCALPVPLRWLREAGLGRDRLRRMTLEGGKVKACIERVFARRVLEEREEVPRGPLAREAVAGLFLEGRLFRDSLEATRDRLQAAALARELVSRGKKDWAAEIDALHSEGVPELEDWVRRRIESLGVESGEDVALLAPEDLLAPDLPAWVREPLDREFPRSLTLPGGVYEAEYDLRKREVTLVRVKGSRGGFPHPSLLPRFAGLRVRVRHRDDVRTLRERG